MRKLWKGQTRYRKHGKIQTPLTREQFKSCMDNGHFNKDEHRAYCILLYYTGVRRAEALRVVKEDFTMSRYTLFFNVHKRLKNGIETPPLEIPRRADYVDELEEAIHYTDPGKRVFPFKSATAYRIVDGVFKAYPHLFRLSRITNFFSRGYTTAQVHSWTGLTLQAMNYYVGIVDVGKMGKSLEKE